MLGISLSIISKLFIIIRVNVAKDSLTFSHVLLEYSINSFRFIDLANLSPSLQEISLIKSKSDLPPSKTIREKVVL